MCQYLEACHGCCVQAWNGSGDTVPLRPLLFVFCGFWLQLPFAAEMQQVHQLEATEIEHSKCISELGMFDACLGSVSSNVLDLFPN